MSHPLALTEQLRRWMTEHATTLVERTGLAPSPEELAADADAACPGSLDPLDVEDLAHEVLEQLRRYPPARGRLVSQVLA